MFFRVLIIVNVEVKHYALNFFFDVFDFFEKKLIFYDSVINLDNNLFLFFF